MATQEVMGGNNSENKVYNHHLDDIPEDRFDYTHSNLVSRQGTGFSSYHDSDSDPPDYELRSMPSFLGADLDKSDADSWDWTFRDENVTDLDIKTIPELAKPGNLLANNNVDLPCENVKGDFDTEGDFDTKGDFNTLQNRLQDSSATFLKRASIDQKNTEQFSNCESNSLYIFQGNDGVGQHENKTTTAVLQKDHNGQPKTFNSHRKHVQIAPLLLSKTSFASHIQNNPSSTDNANRGDDFVYFEDGKSSKVFKVRLQYLGNNCHVGRKSTESGADKQDNSIHKRSHQVRFFTRSSERTQLDTRNVKSKLTKLKSTETRFMYSSCPTTNNVHLRTTSYLRKNTSPPPPLPKLEHFLPQLNDKRFRSLLGKRNSLNDLLAQRVTSWRVNRSWAMSRPDLLVKRPAKDEALAGDKACTRHHSCAGDAGLLRFRRVARLVLILLKAVGRRREPREETNYNFLSWTVVYDEVLGISRLNYDSGTLTFDPLLFKANRESPLSQDIKDILRLPPEHRTEAHIRAVMMSFHNVIPSFSEYPKEIQQSMIKVCTYEKFESGRVIIRQGHRAENFYFIIGGSAVVTQMDSEAGHVHTTNVLGKGNSFGELAFLQMSKRSATVTCRDDVELLCIERDDFIDIFMRPRKGDEPDHIKFLKSVDILRGWPVSLLPHVNPKICAFTYVRRGVILCLDNAHSDWIFVVYSGSCKVLKALDDGPVPGLDGKGHSTEIQTEGSLASNTSNFPQAGKPTTSSASSDNILVHDHGQGGSRCRRLRKYGVSLPAIHTSRDGRGVSLPTVHTSRDGRGVSLPTVHTLRDGHGTSLPVLGSSSTEGQTNRNSAKVSFSDIDHLADIDSILYQKHILPTILRSNQADQENSQETRKVSIRTRILPKSDPIFKPKRQSYGLQPPVLPQLTKPSGETTTTPDQHQHMRKMAFVEVARLEPGDVFGLEHVVLSGIRNVASCSLVSQGAEVVLISKSFFKKHLTEDTLKRMRQLIRPLPSEKALQKTFQKKKLWDMYKSHALSRHRRRVRGAAPQC